MKRLLLTFLAVALVTVAPVSALNVSAGLIVVHNRSDSSFRIALVHELSNHSMEETVIEPGGTYFSRACCYAAGSPYALFVYIRTTKGGRYIYSFKPRLCNKRGTPYGYMAINIRGAHAVNMLDDGCPYDEHP